MARISRKNKAQQTIEHIYSTAIYIRLSIEDSGNNNTDTIEMQKYMLEQFVKNQKDMRLFSIYQDE